MKIGVLGGGQLGRMLALAGHPLGLSFRFLDSSPHAPAAALGELIVGAFDDPAALDRFADGVSIVTYEFENVPASSLLHLERRGIAVHPPIAALQTAQDRFDEKSIFRRLGVPLPEFELVNRPDELRAAIERLGLPAVLKSRRLGYDGKGQAVIRDHADVARLSAEHANDAGPQPDDAGAGSGAHAWSRPATVEQFISFDRELSIIAVRGSDGLPAFYPLAENRHAEGILRVSRAPAPDAPPEVERQAREIAEAVMTELRYVGVLAIEFFEHRGRLLVNEMAPRVHNSGHWTIEGARTSQFENHLRALLGWPLGSTEPLGHSAMVNLIGDAPPTETLLALPFAHVHLYGKSPRPRRKIGHVTVTAATAVERDRSLEQVRRLLNDG